MYLLWQAVVRLFCFVSSFQTWPISCAILVASEDAPESPLLTEVEYICRWLVVATGENAECVTPDIEGLAEFGGDVMHVCDYKSGEKFKGKKVLVVGVVIQAWKFLLIFPTTMPHHPWWFVAR